MNGAQQTYLAMHVLCCIFLAGLALWRSMRTSIHTTKPVVLYRLHVVSLVGILGLVPPLVPGWQPSLTVTLLLFAFCVSEALTIPFWRGGIPDPDIQSAPMPLDAEAQH
jgi:O-antigen ligase